jgi:hypothetical protein
MANAFNLTAQINLRGPGSGAIRPIIADIKRQLGTIKANVDLKVDPKASKSIGNVTSRLTAMNNVLTQARSNADALSITFQNLSNSLTSIRQSSAQASTSIKNINASASASAKNIAQATSAMAEFGKQSGLAIKRFAAYSVVTSGIYGLVNAVTSGFSAFVKFDKELVKLQQVTGKSATGLRDLENQITRLSVNLGVSSESLIGVASTLAQAGLSAEETRIAIEALAKTELAPSFDSIADTTEGAIAAMRQFGIAAGDLESALGSINAVAAAFAVESSDIIAAIQRTGGVFASASKGVSEGTDALNEFIAVFTSVRATTRESAETIATGLRTIFTRIQRAKTIDQLQEFGVQLQDLEGKFVGPYEAVRRLSLALNQLDPRDVRFSQIVEELGGFRQIGKVIPLIQQFSEAQKALAVAQKGQGSLAEAQAVAQLSLANKIAKVREQFLALIRDVGKSDAFQALAKGVLSLTSGLLTLVSAFKPVLPILAIIGAIKGFKAATEFGGGFIGAFKKGGGARGAGEGIGSAVTGGGDRERAEATTRAAEATRLNTTAINNLTTRIDNLINAVNANTTALGGSTFNRGGKVLKFSTGGSVPGTGRGDSVPALLEPKEYVMSRKAVNKVGRNTLDQLNRGGSIKRFKEGGGVASAAFDEGYDGDSFKVNFTPASKPYKTMSRLIGGDTYEINNQKGYSKIEKDKARQATKITTDWAKEASNSEKLTKAFQAANKYDNFGRPMFKAPDLLNTLKSKNLLTGRFEEKMRLGGLIQKFARGGVAQRRVGYIDYDVIANEANAAVVAEAMSKSGQEGIRNYADYLTGLAVKRRKESSLQKLRAIYGVAGSGKTTLARRNKTDQATLRETERFPVLTPEDIDKATEVLVLTSSVSQKKLKEFLTQVDRAYTLSSTTPEEKERVRSQRTSRDITGIGLEGRQSGTTFGAPVDTALGEALLAENLGKRSLVLGRSSTGRLRPKRNDELVEIIKKKIGFTWGGFAPTTRGHESIVDAAAAYGIAPEDFIALVGSNEGVKAGDPSSYRTAILDQDARLLLAKAGFGAKGATVLPKAMDFEVPQGFDVSSGSRRKVILPSAGSTAFVADKSEEQLAKYMAAGYEVVNLPRTEGISGTMVRDLIASGDMAKLQQVLSPGVYEMISNNIGKLQNRANILPSIIEQVQAQQAVSLSEIEKQIKTVGISRIDKKRVASDPAYAAQVAVLEELRDKRNKIKDAGKFEPYKLLARLAALEPDKYALDFSTKPSLATMGDVVTPAVTAQSLVGDIGAGGGVATATATSTLSRMEAARLRLKQIGNPETIKNIWIDYIKQIENADRTTLEQFVATAIETENTQLKAAKLPILGSAQAKDIISGTWNKAKGREGYAGVLERIIPETIKRKQALTGVDDFSLTPEEQARAAKVAIVGLRSGYAGGKVQPPYYRKKDGVPLLVHSGVLPADALEAITTLEMEQLAAQQRAAQTILPGKQLANLSEADLQKLGKANAQGYDLEVLLALLGAPTGQKSGSGDAVDFVGGLPGDLAARFGIPPGIFTQAKRTIDSSSVSDALSGIAAKFRGLRMAFGGKVNGPSFEDVKKQIMDKYPEINFRISKRKRGFGYNILGGLKQEGNNIGNYADFQQASNLEQLAALADKMANELQYVYGPDIDRSLLKKKRKFALGGLAESTDQMTGLMQGLYGTKQTEKPTKQYGKIGLRQDSNSISATYFKNDQRSGNVSAYKLRDYLYYVGLSQATGGYGPRLYDVVMEAATANGAMLTADRSSVSGDAKRVWEYYFNNRADVKKTPLKPDDWTKNQSMIDSKLFGPKETWPPATDPAWVLQSGYSKSPSLINDPNNVMRMDKQIDSRSLASNYFASSTAKFANGGKATFTGAAYLKLNKQQRAEISTLIKNLQSQISEADKNLATLRGYDKGPSLLGRILGKGTTNPYQEQIFEEEDRKLRAQNQVNDLLRQWGSQLSQNKVSKFNSGGVVNALLTPGEAVIGPATAQKIGYSTLHKMNHADKNGMAKYAGGGDVSIVPGTGNSDTFGPVPLPVGSFVIRKKATEALGFNKGGSIGLNKGGTARGVWAFAAGGDVEAYMAFQAEKAGKTLEEFNRSLIYAAQAIAKQIPRELEAAQQSFRAELSGLSATAVKARSTRDKGELDRIGNIISARIKEIDPGRTDAESDKIAKTIRASLAKGQNIDDIIAANTDLRNVLTRTLAPDEIRSRALGTAATNAGLNPDAIKAALTTDLERGVSGLQRILDSLGGPLKAASVGFTAVAGAAALLKQSYIDSGKQLSAQTAALLSSVEALSVGFAITANLDIAKNIRGFADTLDAFGSRGLSRVSGLLRNLAGPIQTAAIAFTTVSSAIGAYYNSLNESNLQTELQNLSTASDKTAIAFKALEKNASDANISAAKDAMASEAGAAEALRTRGNIDLRAQDRSLMRTLADYDPTGLIKSSMGLPQEAEARKAYLDYERTQVGQARQLGGERLKRVKPQEIEADAAVARSFDRELGRLDLEREALKGKPGSASALEAKNRQIEETRARKSEALYRKSQTFATLRESGNTEQDILRKVYLESATTSVDREERLKAIRGESGKTEQERKTNQEKAIAAAKQLLAIEAENERSQRLMADAYKEVQLETENLIRTYDRASALLTKFGQSIDKIKQAAYSRAGAIEGQAQVGSIDRTSENILNNMAAYSVAEVEQAAMETSMMMGGGVGGEQVRSDIVAAKLINEQLPNILARTGSLDAGAAIDELRKSFSLAGVELSDAVAGELEQSLQNEALGREGVSYQDFAANSNIIQEVQQKAAASLKIAQEFQKQYNDALSVAIELTNEYGKALQQATDYQLKASDIRIKSELDLAQALGKSLSLSELDRPLTSRITTLSSGVVQGGTTDPKAIFAGMMAAINNQPEQQAELKRRTDAFGQDNSNANRMAVEQQVRDMAQQNVAINNSRKALEELANDSTAASEALKGLQEQQQIASGSVNFMQKVLTSDADQLQEINKGLAAYTKVISGRATSQDMNSLDFRRNAFAGLENISSMMPESLRGQMQARVTRQMLESTESGRKLLQTQTGGIYRGADGQMKQMTYGDALRMAETGQDPKQKEFIDAYKAATERQAQAADMLGQASLAVAETFNTKMVATLDKLQNTLPDLLKEAIQKGMEGQGDKTDKQQAAFSDLNAAVIAMQTLDKTQAASMGISPAQFQTLSTAYSNVEKAKASTVALEKDAATRTVNAATGTTFAGTDNVLSDAELETFRQSKEYKDFQASKAYTAAKQRETTTQSTFNRLATEIAPSVSPTDTMTTIQDYRNSPEYLQANAKLEEERKKFKESTLGETPPYEGPPQAFTSEADMRGVVVEDIAAKEKTQSGNEEAGVGKAISALFISAASSLAAAVGQELLSRGVSTVADKFINMGSSFVSSIAGRLGFGGSPGVPAGPASWPTGMSPRVPGAPTPPPVPGAPAAGGGGMLAGLLQMSGLPQLGATFSGSAPGVFGVSTGGGAAGAAVGTATTGAALYGGYALIDTANSLYELWNDYDAKMAEVDARAQEAIGKGYIEQVASNLYNIGDSVIGVFAEISKIKSAAEMSAQAAESISQSDTRLKEIASKKDIGTSYTNLDATSRKRAEAQASASTALTTAKQLQANQSGATIDDLSNALGFDASGVASSIDEFIAIQERKIQDISNIRQQEQQSRLGSAWFKGTAQTDIDKENTEYNKAIQELEAKNKEEMLAAKPSTTTQPVSAVEQQQATAIAAESIPSPDTSTTGGVQAQSISTTTASPQQEAAINVATTATEDQISVTDQLTSSFLALNDAVTNLVLILNSMNPSGLTPAEPTNMMAGEVSLDNSSTMPVDLGNQLNTFDQFAQAGLQMGSIFTHDVTSENLLGQLVGMVSAQKPATNNTLMGGLAGMAMNNPQLLSGAVQMASQNPQALNGLAGMAMQNPQLLTGLAGAAAQNPQAITGLLDSLGPIKNLSLDPNLLNDFLTSALSPLEPQKLSSVLQSANLDPKTLNNIVSTLGGAVGGAAIGGGNSQQLLAQILNVLTEIKTIQANCCAGKTTGPGTPNAPGMPPVAVDAKAQAKIDAMKQVMATQKTTDAARQKVQINGDQITGADADVKAYKDALQKSTAARQTYQDLVAGKEPAAQQPSNNFMSYLGQGVNFVSSLFGGQTKPAVSSQQTTSVATPTNAANAQSVKSGPLLASTLSAEQQERFKTLEAKRKAGAYSDTDPLTKDEREEWTKLYRGRELSRAPSRSDEARLLAIKGISPYDRTPEQQQEYMRLQYQYETSKNRTTGSFEDFVKNKQSIQSSRDESRYAALNEAGGPKNKYDERFMKDYEARKQTTALATAPAVTPTPANNQILTQQNNRLVQPTSITIPQQPVPSALPMINRPQPAANAQPTSPQSSPTGMPSVIQLDSKAMEFVNKFGEFVTKLSQINIPSVIEVKGGNHTVDVRVSGAAAFESLQEGMKNLINEAIGDAMATINSQSLGVLGYPKSKNAKTKAGNKGNNGPAAKE